MENNELQHVGVLGMKWGRRRSREIGSITERVNGGRAKKTASLRAKGKNQSQDDFEREVATGILKNKRSSKKEVALAKEILAKQKAAKVNAVKKEKISDVEKKPGWSTKKKVIVGLVAAYGVYTVASSASFIVQAKKLGFL